MLEGVDFFFSPIHPVAFLKIIQAGTPSITSSVYVVFRWTQFLLAFIIQRGLFFCWRPPFEKSQAGSWQGLRSLFLWKDFTVCPPRIPYHGAQSKDVPSCFLIFLMTIRFPCRLGLLTNKRRRVSNHKRYNHSSKTTKHKPFLKHHFLCVSPPPLFPVVNGPWQCQRAPPVTCGRQPRRSLTAAVQVMGKRSLLALNSGGGERFRARMFGAPKNPPPLKSGDFEDPNTPPDRKKTAKKAFPLGVRVYRDS